MRRDLRSVRTETVVGAVDTEEGFVGAAASVLAAMRRDLGDEETIRRVIAEGWSNGYLYFAEATE